MVVCNGFFMVVNFGIVGYLFLIMVVVNLIWVFGDQKQQDIFLLYMFFGCFIGIMVLIEFYVGLLLVDICIFVMFIDDGYYLIKGVKIYIFGGEQLFIENIVYMVFVKIKGVFVGVKGIFLFIVFKFLVDDDGNVIECNGVNLVGLIYKLGYWGIIFMVLSFGDDVFCYGYLVGEFY